MRPIKLLKNLAFAARIKARKISQIRDDMATAANPVHDDLYVVSYPKSGATWMNFLMANIHILASGSSRQVTFYNVTDFVPDIHACRDLRPAPPLPFPGFRVIKSHAPYNPNYKKVIYIVRDPRDTMVSYYNFARKLSVYAGEISAFVRDPHFGIDAWNEHVTGWIENSAIATRIQIVRYEDLKEHAGETMKGVYYQLGHDLEDALLNKAAQLSSFANMKKIEQTYGHGGRGKFSEFEFMRAGESQGWKGKLAAADVDFINQRGRSWIDHFGY